MEAEDAAVRSEMLYADDKGEGFLSMGMTRGEVRPVATEGVGMIREGNGDLGGIEGGFKKGEPSLGSRGEARPRNEPSIEGVGTFLSLSTFSFKLFKCICMSS